MELAEEQRTSQDHGREKDTQQVLVNNLQLQLDGMRSEVERIRQRAVLEEKLKMFEVKIVVKELQEAGKRLQELQVTLVRKFSDLLEFRQLWMKQLEPTLQQMKESNPWRSGYILGTSISDPSSGTSEGAPETTIHF